MIETTKMHELLEGLLLAIDEGTARVSSFTEEISDHGGSELTLVVRRLPPKKSSKDALLSFGERLILQLYERAKANPNEAEQTAENLSLQLMELVEKLRKR